MVLFYGFELLEVFGPVQLLKAVEDIDIGFAVPTTAPVVSSPGVAVMPVLTYRDLAAHDVPLLPGGAGTRCLVDDATFLDWLGGVGIQSPLVASVCTGSALLAAAGLLHAYSATSNTRAFAWASRFGNSVDWRPEARRVHDRDRWTSSGVAAGMDMTVALIADLAGEDQANKAAQRAEYEPRRDSNWDPFARQPLRFGLLRPFVPDGDTQWITAA